MRSCDLHAIKRLDAVYLEQGFIDGYYKRLRDKVKFVLMGCSKAFDTCFCVDMGTNKSDDYDMSMDKVDGKYYMDCKMEEWAELFAHNAEKLQDVQPAYVTETETHVNLPTQMPKAMLQSDFGENTMADVLPVADVILFVPLVPVLRCRICIIQKMARLGKDAEYGHPAW